MLQKPIFLAFGIPFAFQPTSGEYPAIPHTSIRSKRTNHEPVLRHLVEKGAPSANLKHKSIGLIELWIARRRCKYVRKKEKVEELDIEA